LHRLKSRGGNSHSVRSGPGGIRTHDLRLRRSAWNKNADKGMEDLECETVLEGFRDYLKIDRQLEEKSVEKYVSEIKKFIRNSGIDPLKAERIDIRNYLKTFKEIPANSYANILKALRIFYRDYLGKGEVIEGFKFPSRPFNPTIIPSKRELQEFYQWLKEPLAKALFLIYSTTGLRRKEVHGLKIGDIDFQKRMIVPKGNSSRTKRTWVTFFNAEAEEALKEYLGSLQGLNGEAKLFPVTETYFRKRCKRFERETGIKISPQILREWFTSELGRLGVPDRYVDAFCGRVPRSILARHYTDFSPERLREIYERAGLRILENPISEKERPGE
jgi:integrase/recombinase XerD